MTSAPSLERLERLARGRGLGVAPAAAARVLELAERDQVVEGVFDYIVIPEAYARADGPGRDLLVELAARHLADDGLVCIDHETLPGARWPMVIDEMLRWHLRHEPDRARRRDEARRFLELVVEVASGMDPHYCVAILERLEELVADPAAAEELEAARAGELVSETCRRLAAHGLDFLADAEPAADLAGEVVAWIDRHARDPVDREQYRDDFCNRRRRRTLACRAGKVARTAAATAAATPAPAAPPSSFEYDLVHYPGAAHRFTAPEQSELVARVFQLDPCPPARARVLEIGCAIGLNLLPMAERFPEASFVGVDLSRNQIETGRELVAAAGLRNVELQHLDIADLDASFGTFDYIVAHGFYSWVPAGVRERLLAICAQLLGPRGIGWISLDVKPGCTVKHIGRDVSLHHVEGLGSPPARIAAARAYLERVSEACRQRDRLYAVELAEVLSATAADGFFFHDNLAPLLEGFFLHELASRLAAHGLVYFADADLPSMLPMGLAPGPAEALDRMAADPVEREQYLDLLRNRPFRQALVCRADQRPAAEVGRPPLERLWIVAAGPGATAPDGASPATRAALARLVAAWPAAVAFADLPGDDRGRLAEELRACFRERRIELAAGPSPFVTVAPERPRAGAFARHFATRSAVIASLRHQDVHLGDLDRRVLALLDGRRDRAELRRAAGISAKALEKTLASLARMALIMA